MSRLLKHSYLKDFHGQMEEPVCKELFTSILKEEQQQYGSTSKDVMSREEVRLRIFDEVLKYRPRSSGCARHSSPNGC